MDIDGTAKLSKNVLKMKFMQRSLDPEARKQLEEDEKKVISDEHWFLDLPELMAHENVIVMEKGFVSCENLVFGRISFKGFNPEIEKLMAVTNKGQYISPEEEMAKMDTDITDEEMASRYADLVESIKKRFAKKRDHSVLEDEDLSLEEKPKRGFQKPKD
ncbi:M-phase phosphoprotein 6 [Clupea harengus]|uniref:M-phase phosphoprotein 6 n=1 Tax=Clupea harengus TaxID=7950 RepID=A0A6P3VQR9_CLUHA|nr:M-phase phosphoprotein 6 [Clupea harengus]